MDKTDDERAETPPDTTPVGEVTQQHRPCRRFIRSLSPRSLCEGVAPVPGSPCPTHSRPGCRTFLGGLSCTAAGQEARLADPKCLADSTTACRLPCEGVWFSSLLTFIIIIIIIREVFVSAVKEPKPKTIQVSWRSSENRFVIVIILRHFTSKSDQFQSPPAASPAIYHTVWRTWLFADSVERWSYCDYSHYFTYTFDLKLFGEFTLWTSESKGKSKVLIFIEIFL